MYENILTHDSIVDKCVGMDMNIFTSRIFYYRKIQEFRIRQKNYKNLDEILRFS